MVSTVYHYEVAHKVLTGKIEQPCTYGADDAAGLYAAICDLLGQAIQGALARGKLVQAWKLDDQLTKYTHALDTAMAAMAKPINY